MRPSQGRGEPAAGAAGMGTPLSPWRCPCGVLPRKSPQAVHTLLVTPRLPWGVLSFTITPAQVLTIKGGKTKHR